MYQATVKVKVDEATGVEKVPDQTYLGVCEPEWKERLGNHKQDWKKPPKGGATCLSKYIWSINVQFLSKCAVFVKHVRFFIKM